MSLPVHQARSTEQRSLQAVVAYTVTVAGAALLCPILSMASVELGALRNWQYLGLVVAAVVALRGRISTGREPVALDRIGPFLVGALSIWMLAGELLNFLAVRINGIDFSVFDLMLERTLSGQFLYSPLYRVNHFGVHQTWPLLALVPLHLVWRHPSLLLVVNAAVLGAALVPLWKLGRRIDPRLAPLLLIAFATNPWTARLLRDGFRPESFYPLCIFALAEAVLARRTTLVVGWALGLCLVKEDGGFYVVAFAVSAGLAHLISRRTALLVAAIAVGVLVVDLAVIRPWQLGDARPGYVQFWSGYGTSLGGIALGVFRHPLRAVWDVLSAHWWVVLGPALLLPLREPVALGTMVPGLLMLGLSSNEEMRRFGGYYPVPIACIALVGLACFAARHPRPAARSLIALAAAVAFPLFGAGYFRIHRPDPEMRRGLSELRLALATPGAGSLCVQGAIIPQLPYLEVIGPLDAQCLAPSASRMLVNPSLDPWPYAQSQLERQVQDAVPAGTGRTFAGGFFLAPAPDSWP